MTIEMVRRFCCPRCNYITEDARSIELIEEQGSCPACGNGEPKAWLSNATTGELIAELRARSNLDYRIVDDR